MGKDISCKHESKEKSSSYIIAHKVNFKTKKITGDRGEYYLMMKVQVYQEDKALLNGYIQNNRAKSIWSET